jgi:glycosyltransferase involved in cell wall biosynthesis
LRIESWLSKFFTGDDEIRWAVQAGGHVLNRSMRRALYVSHTGMTEPLGQSQVFPYLYGLSQFGWEIDVVAFEPASASRDEIDFVRSELSRTGMHYHYSRRSPTHALPIKAAEATRAFVKATLRALKRRPRVIHARSHLAASVAAAVASFIPQARFLFDCRGLLGDEYVDAGHWSRDSFRYHLVKNVERVLLDRADAVVVLTDRARRWLKENKLVTQKQTIEVIPCCVDLDRFRFDGSARARERARLGLLDDQLLLIYSGSLGSWYCEEQMAAFYASLRRRRKSHFLVLTHSPVERLRQAMSDHRIPENEVTIERATPTAMPAMLSAADAAICLVFPSFSKMASSPTKVPEYLAVGLPVVMNLGVGDGDRFIEKIDTMISAGHMSLEELELAATRLVECLQDGGLRTRARAAAVKYFDVAHVGIERYRTIYERLLS